MVTGIQKSSNFVPEIEQERSRISRTYKLFVTGPDTVSPFHLRSFSVRSPFYSRSTFVVHLFHIRFFSVPQRKTNGKKRKKTESKRIRSEEEANLQRTCGELAAKSGKLAANLRRISGELAAKCGKGRTNNNPIY